MATVVRTTWMAATTETKLDPVPTIPSYANRRTVWGHAAGCVEECRMPTGIVLIELGAMLIVLALLARIANRLALSPVPMYLLAGILFGAGGPYPLVESLEFIEVAAEIGVVLLLFTLGLEFSSRRLVREFRETAVSGVADFLLNFTPGFVIGLVIGWGLLASFILGGITYISSSGIAAEMIRDFHWFDRPETGKVIGVLVFEDLVMTVYLALAGVLLFGAMPWEAALAATVAVALVIGTIWVGYHYSERISTWVFRHRGEVLLLGLMGLALLFAGIGERLDVSAAVGAFLAGMLLSGEASHGRRATAFLEPLRDLFAAAFFVLFGLQLESEGLSKVILPVILLVIVTSLTKFGTGLVVANRSGAGRQAGLRAGATLMARGEFSIVIAELARRAGQDQEIAATAGLYVAILAVLGPVTVRFIAHEEG